MSEEHKQYTTYMIAKKNDISDAKVRQQIRYGEKHEFKSLNNSKLVRQIVTTNVYNDPTYYTKNGIRGGLVAGKSHENGGVQAITDNGTPLEVEAGEVVINKKAVELDAGHSLDGKDMTNKQILNVINTETGGRAIMADGGGVNDINPKIFSIKELSDQVIEAVESDYEEKKGTTPVEKSEPLTVTFHPKEAAPKNVSKNSQYTINEQIRALVEKNGTERTKYTDQELSMLEQYTGKGGMKDQYLEDYKAGKIKDLQGFLYEFYTPDSIVEKMWGLAYQHGFKGQTGERVLENSCGIGRFLKLAPKNCKVTAFEVDKISYAIAKVLYPKFTIYNKSFETEFFMGSQSLGSMIRNKYNLVIGNCPYGDYNSEYSDIEKKHTAAVLIEHYFIARSIDSLLPNGLLVYIIPSGFLQNNNNYNQFKEKLSGKAELIDAYRLPEKSFSSTDIGTDIIVLKRK